MAKGEVPQAVLAEQLGEAIAGRKVRAAVFTTFCFDPGFFELHVLPTLFARRVPPQAGAGARRRLDR